MKKYISKISFLQLFLALGAVLMAKFGMAEGLAVATGGMVLLPHQKNNLERLAFQELSNFDGYSEDYVGGGAIAPATRARKVFVMTIDSADTVAGQVYLYSGYLVQSKLFTSGLAGNTYGQVVDNGFRKIGGSALDYTGSSGSTFGINEFLAFGIGKKQLVTGFSVESTTSTVHSGIINIEKKEPYQSLGSYPIHLGRWRKPGDYNQNITVVDEGFELDDQTFVTMTIPAGASVTITFYLA